MILTRIRETATTNGLPQVWDKIAHFWNPLAQVQMVKKWLYTKVVNTKKYPLMPTIQEL